MKFATYRDRDNYDTRHGGPFDRGSADSYYHRVIIIVVLHRIIMLKALQPLLELKKSK